MHAHALIQNLQNYFLKYKKLDRVDKKDAYMTLGKLKKSYFEIMWTKQLKHIFQEENKWKC